MRIGLGVTRLSLNEKNKKLDGIAYYTKNLIKELSKLKIQLHLLQFGKKGVDQIDGIRINKMQSFPLILLWDFIFFYQSRRLKRDIDFFHSTDHLVPIYQNIPVIATVMDTFPISIHRFSKVNLVRLLKNKLWIITTRQADHIITISEYSKNEIMHNMKIHESKISVVPLGVSDFYFKRTSKNLIQKILNQYQIPEHYFLFIGTIQPRKNIELMISAHDKVFNYLGINYPLVIVGNNHSNYLRLINLIRQKQKTRQVLWIQFLSDEKKRALMQNAEALLLPSLYEGFGLTVLEGFASKVPVIASDILAIKEVAKGAALLINPFSERSLTNAMVKIIQNPKIKALMVKKGYKRAKQMSWEKTAFKTLAIYQKVLKEYARPSLL